jgi:hypothetical protein
VLPAGRKNDHDAADIVRESLQVDHCYVARPPGPAGQRASQAGREGTRDGGPSTGPSDRLIGER